MYHYSAYTNFQSIPVIAVKVVSCDHLHHADYLCPYLPHQTRFGYVYGMTQGHGR